MQCGLNESSVSITGGITSKSTGGGGNRWIGEHWRQHVNEDRNSNETSLN